MCVQNKVPTVINMVLFLSVVEFLSGNSALILDTEVFNCRTTGSIVPVRKAGRNDFINRWAHQESCTQPTPCCYLWLSAIASVASDKMGTCTSCFYQR